MTSRSPVRNLPERILSALKGAVGRRWRGVELSAEDASQEIVARLLSTADGTDAVRIPEAFIGQALRNLSIDEHRKIRNRGGNTLPLDDLDRASAPWTAPDQEPALLLKQVNLGLPEIYRDAFILNRFIGLTYAEIAERQGITVKAVEYRMSRALALCAEALRD